MPASAPPKASDPIFAFVIETLFPTFAELAVADPEIVTLALGSLGSIRLKMDAEIAVEASYTLVPVM